MTLRINDTSMTSDQTAHTARQLRTGQLGSVKAGRRRLIAKHHLEAFLAGEP
jgi:hypothetical protein